MTVDLILFFILAAIAVVSALGLIFSKNPVYAALFLIMNFLTLAVYYLLLKAAFIAVVQVTVYAGAIMVLFLFVIMLLGTEHLRGIKAVPWQRPLAYVLALALVAETGYIFFFKSEVLQVVTETAKEFGSPTGIGTLLFREYLLPFEVTSVLLLAAMVGVIVITKLDKPRSPQKDEDA